MTGTAGTAGSFRVHGSFVIGARSLFIVRGIIAGGDVRIGQIVVRPEGIDSPVTAVESRLSSVSGGSDQTALMFRYTSRAQLGRWEALARPGVELTLADPADEDGPTTTSR